MSEHPTPHAITREDLSTLNPRAAARLRYGWDDHCESCGLLARECGHRQPEREGSRG